MKATYTLLLAFIFLSSAAQTEKTISDTIILTEEKALAITQDDNPMLFWHRKRFKVSAGLYFPVNNTEVRVDGSEGNFGTTIDLEDDLGFEANTFSWVGAFEWRISRRSRLNFEYFYLNRESSKTLEREIEFEDNTYEVNARVYAFFDMQIFRIAYGYAFVSKPKYEIGAVIGAHTVFADMGIGLETSIGQAEASDDFNFTAPLPDLGLWGEVVLGPKFGLYANVNYLALKVDNIEGRIVSSNLSLLYNVYKNFNLTLGYTGLHVKVDVERERASGSFKWGYNGPMLTANYTFGGNVRSQKKQK